MDKPMLELITALWPIFAAIGGTLFASIVWCVRLESELRYLRKDYEEHKQNQAQKSETIWAKIDILQAAINTVLQALGRVEGKIDAKNE